MIESKSHNDITNSASECYERVEYEVRTEPAFEIQGRRLDYIQENHLYCVAEHRK